MEVLLVVSLISIINIALYNALVNGLRIWERSQRLVVEQDLAVFFDKIAQDLRNSFLYSRIKFNGNDHRFSFPTRVHILADPKSDSPIDQYISQLGRVEYYFDTIEKKIYRHQANYGQALSEEFSRPTALVNAVETVEFQYIYLTDNEEIVSREVLDIPPSGVDIEVHFSDSGVQKSVRKLIAVPIGS
ncbi:MAG: hypothetical protein UV05_C0001G0011 [candidate division CPR1 bacterium GW2011_GWA2_42_17]|uniref:Uncharacterized protein n=1 Tax=candidate division CPR1 bacterium GW2011_GWA2_42_17 TaxID=1618341 RepID=A0A0G1BEG3_9BACT|nr:MAG: hypothetical protein UV05_C0001G0011 [candidate division CPR1 bacterium GW2011_GWA2_42_17]